MAQIIPFQPSPSANFQFQATLDDDVQYNCVCTFNAYAQRYYLSIYDLVGNLVVSRPVVASPSFYNVSLTLGYFETTMIYRESSQSFEIPGLPAVPLVRPKTPSIATPYPLDPLSARPAVAYSTRRLLASYTGPCLRVRRASDGAEADINFLTTSLDVGALIAFVGNADGTVVTWYDQSGNGFNATQIGVSFQPLIASGGFVVNSNGFPALFVNANNLNFDNRHAARVDFTIASVFSTTQNNPVTTPSGGYNMSGFVYADVGGRRLDFGFGNLNDRLCLWGGDVDVEKGVVGTTIINDGSTHSGITTRVSSTGEISIYLDGLFETSGLGPFGPRTDADFCQIGSYGGNTPGGDGSAFPGIFFTPEDVIYASKLSANDLYLLQQAQAVYTT